MRDDLHGHVVQRFTGLLPFPPADHVDDWGLTPVEQETQVERFRQVLEERGLWRKEDHDYYTLLRFLRARNYDRDKALKMWSDSLAWRRAYEVDSILEGFVFHERERFLMAYPQGYHKTDKLGRPVYIQLLGKIDISSLRRVTTEERMVKFHIQEYERAGRFIFPVCSCLAGRQIDQTFGIMDVKGVGLTHITGEVKRLVSVLTKYDQDNYPESLGRLVIINAPLVFRGVWQLIKPMLNPRTLNKIQICSTDYVSDLLQWIEPENLPVWLGGRSKGTLLDDVGPWSDPEVLTKLEPVLPAAGAALRALRAAGRAEGEEAWGDVSEAGGEMMEIEEGEGSEAARAPSGFYAASEASFASVSSASSAAGQSLTLTGGGLTRASIGSASSEAGAGQQQQQQQQQHRHHHHHPQQQQYRQGSPPRRSRSQTGAEGVGPHVQGGHAAEGGVEGAADDLVPAVPVGRPHSLVERVQALEQLYAQQVQRLRGYMPAGGPSRIAAHRLQAPPGSLLQRVDLLEDGLDLLLRAQELSWQEAEEKKRAANAACCGGPSGCTIM